MEGWIDKTRPGCILYGHVTTVICIFGYSLAVPSWLGKMLGTAMGHHIKNGFVCYMHDGGNNLMLSLEWSLPLSGTYFTKGSAGHCMHKLNAIATHLHIVLAAH